MITFTPTQDDKKKVSTGINFTPSNSVANKYGASVPKQEAQSFGGQIFQSIVKPFESTLKTGLAVGKGAYDYAKKNPLQALQTPTSISSLITKAVVNKDGLTNQFNNFKESYKPAIESVNKNVPLLNQGGTAKDITTKQGLKQTAGDVAQVGINFVPAARVAKIGQGVLRSSFSAPVIAEGAALGFTGAAGNTLSEGGSFSDAYEQGKTGALFGSLGNPAFNAVGNIAGKTLGKVIPSYGDKITKNTVQQNIPDFEQRFQRVLDNMLDPDNFNKTMNNSIKYTKEQFPNITETLVNKGIGVPKVVKENGIIKFKTGAQAEKANQDFYVSSQKANEVAKRYDNNPNTQIFKDDVLSIVDDILAKGRYTGDELVNLRKKLLGTIDNDFRGASVNGSMRPSEIDNLRRGRTEGSEAYDAKGNPTGEVGVNSEISKIYKETLANIIKDREFLVALQTSHDSATLKRFLNTINGQPVDKKGKVSKVIGGIGQGIKTAGGILPFKIGGPIEAVGSLIKAISKVGTEEQKMLAKSLQSQVTRAQRIGINPLSDESIINQANDLQARVDKSRIEKPVNQYNQNVLNSVKNDELQAERKSSINFFNKKYGYGLPEDTEIDVSGYKNRFQNALGNIEKNKVLGDLYEELGKEGYGRKMNINGTEIISPKINKKLKQNLSQNFAGAGLGLTEGFEKDENGNVRFNTENAVKGAAGLSLLGGTAYLGKKSLDSFLKKSSKKPTKEASRKLEVTNIKSNSIRDKLTNIRDDKNVVNKKLENYYNTKNKEQMDKVNKIGTLKMMEDFLMEIKNKKRKPLYKKLIAEEFGLSLNFDNETLRQKAVKYLKENK